MSGVSAFFYGTLLHPKVLKRVLGNDGYHLSICPAILLDHTRHRVRNCDYPAVVPFHVGRTLFDRDLDREEMSVRGNLVHGLSESDIDLLDTFEGDEYSRQMVTVYPIGPTEPFNHPSRAVIASHSSPLPAPEAMINPIKTHVYIWTASLSLLVPELWSYETFIRDSAQNWVGPGEDENEDYKEVDRRREMNGFIEQKAIDAVTNHVVN